MNSSGPDRDEARLGGLGVGIDEALGQEDRLGRLAVLAAPRAAVHQPRPRAPVVAHRLPRPPSSRRPGSAQNPRRLAKTPARGQWPGVIVRVTAASRRINGSPLIFACRRNGFGQGMAYFGVTATEVGLQAAAPGEDLEAGLRRRLARCPPTAPIVVLIHGFKFHPDLARRRPAPLALRARAARRRPRGAELAGGSRLPRRRRRDRPLHRLRLAGQRADAGEPRHHRAQRLRPRLRPRRRLWRAAGRARGAAAAAGAGPAGRPAWRIRSARGWRSPPCRRSPRRRGG